MKKQSSSNRTSSSSADPKSGELPQRRFSRAKTVAERLGVHARTVHRWADAGLIHKHKINPRVVLFDETEVDAFIQQTRAN